MSQMLPFAWMLAFMLIPIWIPVVAFLLGYLGDLIRKNAI